MKKYQITLVIEIPDKIGEFETNDMDAELLVEQDLEKGGMVIVKECKAREI